MNASKTFLEKKRLEGLEIAAYIPSKSHPGEKHLVVKKNGIWECDCISGQMRKECRHIKEMAKRLNESDICFYCGTTFYAAGGLDQHHVVRRSIAPERVKDETNLMALCRKCHDRATREPEFEATLQNVWNLQRESQ